MAGPWEQYQNTQAPPAPAADGPWAKYQTAKPKTEPYSGSILPFSKDAEGNVSFDTNAGFIGSLKRALSLPSEVYEGKVDPLSNEGIDRAREMAGWVSPMNPAVRSGDFAIPGMKRQPGVTTAVAPNSEELLKAGGGGFNAVRDMGVHYRSDAVASVANQIRTQLEKDGIIERVAPDTYSILKALEAPPANSTAPLSGVEAAQRVLKQFRQKNIVSNPTDREAARKVIEGLNEFIKSAGDDPAAVVAGPAAAAGKLHGEANANYAAGKRLELLEGKKDSAELRAAATNSGANFDNILRQRAVSILDNPRLRAGFNEQELKLLEEVAKGTASRNTVRYVGNLLGGGGGLGAAALGILTAGWVPAVGAVAKTMGNKGTRKVWDMLMEEVGKRSPLYQQRIQEAPMMPGPRSIPGALAPNRMLAPLMGGNMATSPPQDPRQRRGF